MLSFPVFDDSPAPGVRIVIGALVAQKPLSHAEAIIHYKNLGIRRGIDELAARVFTLEDTDALNLMTNYNLCWRCRPP